MISHVLNALAVCAFVYACFVAASDAQGAVGLIFLLPIVIILFLISAMIAQKKKFKSARIASIAGVVFTGLFLIFSFIPGLSTLPVSIISGVSTGFEMVTGKSPYAWTRTKNDILFSLNSDLKKSKFIMSQYETQNEWKKICFLGPYTIDEDGKKIIGFDIKLSNYSMVSTSDSVTSLLFVNDSRLSYFIDYPRSMADFSKLSGQCFEKDSAVFVPENSGSKVFIHSK